MSTSDSHLLDTGDEEKNCRQCGREWRIAADGLRTHWCIASEISSKSTSSVEEAAPKCKRCNAVFRGGLSYCSDECRIANMGGPVPDTEKVKTEPTMDDLMRQIDFEVIEFREGGKREIAGYIETYAVALVQTERKKAWDEAFATVRDALVRLATGISDE